MLVLVLFFEGIQDLIKMQLEYEYEITINLSRFQVAEYFTNPNTFFDWFYMDITARRFIEINYEHVEGKPGQPGAKGIIRQTAGTRYPDHTPNVLTIHHTIIKNDLPYEHVATFELGRVKQTSYSYFQEEGSNVTRWINRNEVDLSGMSKIARFFTIKGSFERRTKRMMKRFKKHAERFYAYQMEVESRLVK